MWGMLWKPPHAVQGLCSHGGKSEEGAVSLTQFRWMALLAIPLLLGPVHGEARDYASLQDQAERLYAEKSYARAHALYAESQPPTAAEHRWVAFRLADTRWRMVPDCAIEEAQEEL